MKKRILCTLMALAVMLSTAACSPSQNDQPSSAAQSTSGDASQAQEASSNLNPAGELPIVKEQITLKASALQTPQVEDLKTNAATLELEKKTNIKLDLEVIPEASGKEKRNLLITSGDYPDIFMSGQFSAADIASYGVDQKILIPMNDMIEKYGIETKKINDIVPNFSANIQAGDGNIYALPSINECLHCVYPGKLWMNTSWLEKLNLKVPETTEEFRDVLLAFKNGDPNGNGKKDEIAFTGVKPGVGNFPMMQYLMSSFIQYDGTYFVKRDNKLKFIANTEEWKKGIEYANSLYKDGLIDPSAFTQELDQLRQQTNQETVVVGSAANLHPRAFVNMDTDGGERHKQYNSIPPLKGPDGYRTASLGVAKLGPGGYFAITDKCKEPEAAFRFADYLYSEEGSLIIGEGPEGLGYKAADGVKLGLDGKPAKYERIEVMTGSAKVQNVNWHQQSIFNWNSNYRAMFVVDQDIYSPTGYEKRLFDATTDNYVPYKSNEVIDVRPAFSKEQNDIISQVGTNLETYIQQSLVRFISGDMSITNDWGTYLKGLEDMGLKEYVQVHADAFELEIAQ